jgi:hypothetical protein
VWSHETEDVVSSAAIVKRLGLPILSAGVLVLALTAGSALSSIRPLPKKPEIARHILAAVAISHARVVKLRIVPPNRLYSLTVQVPDPAAYLKYRAHRLVTVMNRLTSIQHRFQSRYFAVLDRLRSRVLWSSQHRRGGVETSRLYIRPALEDCARNLAFPNEIDPDNTAPPCPR